MERLPNSVLENAIRVFVIGEKSALDKCVLSFLKELQELREAEENRLLVRLPCKIGDTVYFILKDECDPKNINGYIVSTPHKVVEVCKRGFFTGSTRNFPYDSDFEKWDEIGKAVFLTQAEAEEKLKEMEDV